VKLTLLSFVQLLLAAFVARGAELPQFVVPGQEVEMKALNELHALHAKTAFSECTLWDVWLPHATLWTGQTAAYRASFLKRRMDAEGYVSMQQHRGMAHSEGWPFPTWQQSGEAGVPCQLVRPWDGPVRVRQLDSMAAVTVAEKDGVLTFPTTSRTTYVVDRPDEPWETQPVTDIPLTAH
jgi:hypothetical protein